MKFNDYFCFHLVIKVQHTIVRIKHWSSNIFIIFKDFTYKIIILTINCAKLSVLIFYKSWQTQILGIVKVSGVKKTRVCLESY